MACSNVRLAVFEKFNSAEGPGPSKYNMRTVGDSAESTKARSPTFKMPRADRVNFSNSSEFPSPLTYDTTGIDSTGGNHAVTRPRSATSVIGRAERSSLYGNSQTPAPNSYSVETSLRPHIPFGRIGTASRSSLGGTGTGGNNPGPASYNIPEGMGPQPLSPKPTAPRAHFGHAARGENMGKLAQGPSPLTYDTTGIDSTGGKHAVTRPRSSTSIIGRAERSNLYSTTLTPGPSQYAPETSLRPHIQFGKMGTASRDSLNNTSSNMNSPSPAQYMVETASSSVLPRSPIAKIGTSSRDSRSASNTPGPANYDTVGKLDAIKTSAARTLMGKAARYGVGGGGAGMNNTPSPLTYDTAGIDSTGGKHAVTRPRSSTSIIGRAERSGLYSASNTPGPANYDTVGKLDAIKTSAAKTRIGTAARSPLNAHEDIPGPNRYHPEESLRPHIPQGRIGKSNRSSLSWNSATPAPNLYRPDTSVSLPKSPAFSMRAR